MRALRRRRVGCRPPRDDERLSHRFTRGDRLAPWPSSPGPDRDEANGGQPPRALDLRDEPVDVGRLAPATCRNTGPVALRRPDSISGFLYETPRTTSRSLGTPGEAPRASCRAGSLIRSII